VELLFKHSSQNLDRKETGRQQPPKARTEATKPSDEVLSEMATFWATFKDEQKSPISILQRIFQSLT